MFYRVWLEDIWKCLFVFVQAEFVWHKLSADNMDPDFVERRRVGLENFLLRVASHPVLSNDKIFYSFLTQVLMKEQSLSQSLFPIFIAITASFSCIQPQEH